ncbi:MAG: thioredoxin fold domain-containing protein [Thaumarchaeota archaeon]|nr:thioredoxin fold domain-containing protein [Nitrososphaerota archaeon]
MTTVDIDSNNWQEKVISSTTPVIVDFWAPWCPWCMRLMPVFEEVSKQYDGKLIFAKLNVEEHQDIAQANGILGIPVMKIFCDGRNVGELVGYMSKEKLVQELDKMLSTIKECIAQSSTLTKEMITK